MKKRRITSRIRSHRSRTTALPSCDDNRSNGRLVQLQTMGYSRVSAFLSPLAVHILSKNGSDPSTPASSLLSKAENPNREAVLAETVCKVLWQTGFFVDSGISGSLVTQRTQLLERVRKFAHHQNESRCLSIRSGATLFPVLEGAQGYTQATSKNSSRNM